MKFTQYFSKRQPTQKQPLKGAGQVKNSAGGYVWSLQPMKQLERFLILGSEGGTFYVSEQKLTRENAMNLETLIHTDGVAVVQRIVAVSESGRAAKNDAAIFALAMCASLGSDVVRREALIALPRVCRTGTHLFQFLAECQGLRGWGRGLRKAVGRWYNEAAAEQVTYQAMKYQSRNGWSHRDALRLAHPVPATEEHKAIYKWIVDGELTAENARLEAFEKLKRADNAAEAAKLIVDFKLPRECVPTELLTKAQVWEALLQDMPMTAMLRNLGTMSKVGLLQAKSDSLARVMSAFEDRERLRRARVHPLAILMAMRVYVQGRGMRGSGTWTPVSRLVDTLDETFYRAFEFVEPSNKRFLLAVDVSSSMSWSMVAGAPISACEAAAAMALVTMNTEPWCESMGFAQDFRKLELSSRMRLKEAMRHTQLSNFGSTDCAMPMIWAREKKVDVDVFVVYTDNETYCGSIHPSRALQAYRDKRGIDAKLVVMGMCANKFTIADPKDAGMLDVVGFDASVPQVLRSFVA